MPLPWHADLALATLVWFSLAATAKQVKMSFKMSSQHFDVVRVRVRVSVSVSVCCSSRLKTAANNGLRVCSNNNNSSGNNIELHQLQPQLQVQLCLRVICALFMQHSAHDETCNIAEIVKCRRRRAVDVATVHRRSSYLPASLCLLDSPLHCCSNAGRSFGNCTNETVAAHMRMGSSIRKGFQGSERWPK